MLKVPFSMKPLRGSIQFMDAFVDKVTKRLGLLEDSFVEQQGSMHILDGKWALKERHLEVVNRTLKNVHDSLRFQYQKFRGLSQAALASTLEIRQPPKSWYNIRNSGAETTESDSYSPDRRLKRQYAASFNETVTEVNPLGREKRGVLALVGTLASSVMFSEAWPLISSQPVIATLHSWLRSLGDMIGGGSPVEKALEREVHRTFQMQKSVPHMGLKGGMSDPSLMDYLKLLHKAEGPQVFLKKGVALLTNITGMTPPVDIVNPRAKDSSSVSSDLWEHVDWFSRDYKSRYKFDPSLGKLVKDYTQRVDGVHVVALNLFKLLSECQETLLLLNTVFEEQTSLVSGYMELLQDLNRGSSIVQSQAHMRAWSFISAKLGEKDVVKSARKQLARLVPKLYLVTGGKSGPAFQIHLVIQDINNELVFDLFRSQTVPFSTNLGTLEAVVPETAQIVNPSKGSLYRFSWNRLSECQLFENTYYCDRSVLESDSSGRCVDTITSSHLEDVKVMERCQFGTTKEEMRLIRLSDDLIYFDVPPSKVKLDCAVSRSFEIRGKGMLHLNPQCSVQVGVYHFQNKRGLTYSNTGSVVSIQREMRFPELSLRMGNVTLKRYEPTMEGWSMSDVMVVAQVMILINLTSLLVIVICAFRVLRPCHRRAKKLARLTSESPRSESRRDESSANLVASGSSGVSLEMNARMTRQSRGESRPLINSQHPRRRSGDSKGTMAKSSAPPTYPEISK